MNNLYDKEIEQKLSELEIYVEKGDYNEFFAAYEAFQQTEAFKFLKKGHLEKLASLKERAMYRKNFLEGMRNLDKLISNEAEMER